MSARVYENGALRAEWNDSTRLYTTWDASGRQTSQRPYTISENALADATVRAETWEAARQAYLSQLAAGVPGILAAKDAAQADIAVASSLNAQASALSGQAQTHVTQMQAWTPTANLAGVTALRDALIAVVQRQKVIIDALAESFGYRQAVDANAVATDDALLWLARLVSDRLLDN